MEIAAIIGLVQGCDLGAMLYFGDSLPETPHLDCKRTRLCSTALLVFFPFLYQTSNKNHGGKAAQQSTHSTFMLAGTIKHAPRMTSLALLFIIVLDH
jgi:hypothetical protein